MINKNNKNFRAGAIITGLMLLIIIVGAFWTPYDPNAMNGAAKWAKPSFEHLLGADNFGRDIFSRLVEGAGATFFIAAASVAIGLVIGLIIGGFTGWYGGWIDEVLMRIIDSITAFPSILLALVLIAILPSGKYNIIIALGLLFIPSFARIVRMEVAKQKNLDYVRNAKLMGVSDMRILFVHILPNVWQTLLSAITIGINNAVLAEAAMSYLNIGTSPDRPSLGYMLSESQAYLSTTPWYAISCGLVIVLLILGVSLIGEGLGRKNV